MVLIMIRVKTKWRQINKNLGFYLLKASLFQMRRVSYNAEESFDFMFILIERNHFFCYEYVVMDSNCQIFPLKEITRAYICRHRQQTLNLFPALLLRKGRSISKHWRGSARRDFHLWSVLWEVWPRSEFLKVRPCTRSADS